MPPTNDQSFEQQVPKDKRDSLARRLLAAGSDAPQVLLEAAIDANGAWAAEFRQDSSGNTAEIDETVSRIIQSHVQLARAEGAALAAALTAAELGTVVGSAGVLTAPAAVTGVVTDLAGLAWIQTRMVLTIAALHGHDPQNGSRYRELVSLMGLYGAPTTDAASHAVSKGAGNAITRLTMRHLKGSNLKAVKSLFNLVGIKFTRVGLIKVIPFVNVPVSAVLNGGATKALGKRAKTYYRTLPTPENLSSVRHDETP